MNAQAPADAFFLGSGDEQRFCLFHPPLGPSRGAILYLHPFAEELNRSRRMAALSARALAAQGHAVLQIDLAGCGDSSGDFAAARWSRWRRDVEVGAQWLRTHHPGPLRLWGLRLGALLALQHAHSYPHQVAGLLLWQPVHSGAQHLTQFLRLQLAHAMLAHTGASGGTKALRETLQRGTSLEIAGYLLHPELAMALDTLTPLAALPPSCPVDWLEAVANAEAAPGSGATNGANSWLAAGVDLRLHPVVCAPFWLNPEAGDQLAWHQATLDVLEARHV